MKKRLLSILLMCCMVLTLLPVTAHAMTHWNLYCETCKKDVLNKDGAEYVYVDGTFCKYVTTCPDCGSELSQLTYHASNDTATCTTGKICIECGHEYGVLGHDWSFASNGEGTHARTCQREGCGVTETVNCSGGTATCIAKAVCKDCGAEYGEIDSNNHTGGTATCTEKAICQRCGEEYGKIDPNNHTGGEATCTAKAICQRCGEEYGEIDPDNHDYEVTVTEEPTCVEPGSASYICKNCNVSGTETIPATGHRFDQLPWKEVSTAEGSGIEFECAVCHIKETRPLHVIEYKAGETYTYAGQFNDSIIWLEDLLDESDKYDLNLVGESAFTIKTSAGKLLLTLTFAEDTKVWTVTVDKGVTGEDGDTVIVYSDDGELSYGVKCSFIAIAYTITYDLDGGTAEGNPTGYNADTDTFTLKNPTRPGYTFTGWSGTDLTGENNLTVTIPKGSTGDRAYKAHWVLDDESDYTIRAIAGKGGSISPSGNVSVRKGEDQTFIITPSKGYAVANVKIDGSSIGAVKSYTFENVTEAHTIEVVFMKANGNPQTGVLVDAVTGNYYVD